MRAVRKGESWAICFFLKCQGKHRGYIERIETKQVGTSSEQVALSGKLAQRIDEILGRKPPAK